MLEIVKTEAAKHGALVREFKDLGLDKFLHEAQDSWYKYQSTLNGAYLRTAQRAYWRAYSSDPLSFKQVTY